MSSSTLHRETPRTLSRRTAGWASDRRIILTGIGLIFVQLAFRGWVISKAWFQQDDFAFMQRSLGSPLNLDYLLTPHVGHFMPAGFLLTWINNAVDPLLFALPASELFVMQAIASVACLAVLVHMFGPRWGIIPPLAIFLFSPITIPAFSWWAAGINQLPVLIVLFLGLHTHITYLRQRTFRHAVYTVLWIVVGLLFTEKTLLVFEIYGLVALGYFAQGHIADRVKGLWRDYRSGILLYSLVPLVFVPYYYLTSINFDASEVNDHPLGALAFNMAGVAYSTGIVGGPLDWVSANVFSGIADPSDLFMIASWGVLAGVVFVAMRTRARSKRAWLIVVAILGTNILLVATGRAFVVGAVIGLEYRYQTEVVAGTAIAVALAYLPIIGAKETVEVVEEHPILDSRSFWTGAIALMFALSVLTTRAYMAPDLSPLSPRAYFEKFESSLPEDGTVPLADRGVPDRIWPAFSFPGNLYSRMFVVYEERLTFPKVANDSLYMVDDRGRIRPVVLDVFRQNVQPEDPRSCAYPVRGGERVRIPLDGPVIGFGWWLRIAYGGEASGPVRIHVGDSTYDTEVEPGLHSIFAKADGEYESISISGLDDGDRICITDVTLGVPQPFRQP